MLASVNPATEEVIETFDELSPEALEAKLQSASVGYQVWRQVPLHRRITLINQLATTLGRNLDAYAQLITAEMGKPIVEAEAELRKCIGNCHYYAKNGPRFLADQWATAGSRSVVAFQPLGVVLGIMPWNYPFWQVFRFLVPTVLAGNVVILKHASNVPRCAMAIEAAVEAAGFPEGVFTSLLLGAGRVPQVIEDERIAAVTVTGSSPVGAEVAQLSARQLKKHVLELGGSDAFVVLADADIDAAVSGAMRGRFQNAGQSCVAAKRFLVVRDVFDEFITNLVARVGALRVGDPMDRATNVGPLARSDLVHTATHQVARSIDLGATRWMGEPGGKPRGYYFAPVVLSGVGPGMPVFDEETFAPIAAITQVADDEEATDLANRSVFGLAASIWTRDLERAEALARRLEVGFVGINRPVSSDPALPFGGIRQSGYGRELGSYGIREFTNVKGISFA